MNTVQVLPEPSTQRMVEVRTQLQELAERLTKDHVEMGCLLWEASANEYFRDWGYISFFDYVEQELDFKRRKAEYLRRIYGRFVVELGIDKQDVLDIKWTKAALIEPLLDKGNVQQWMSRARELPYDDLEREVRSIRKKAGAEAPPLQPTSSDPTPSVSQDPNMQGGFEGNVEVRRYNLYPKQVRNVDRAFEIASGTAKSEKPGHLLDMICLEFLANRGHVSDDPNSEIQTWLMNMKQRFPDLTVLALRGTPEQRSKHLRVMADELDSKS